MARWIYRQGVRKLPGEEFSDPRVVAAFREVVADGLRDGEREFVAGLPPTATPFLDLGAGAGREAGPIRDRGLFVVAADISRPMLVAFAHRDIACVQCDATRLPFRTDAFGGALLPNLVIQYIPFRAARRRALAEARRVLRPDAHGYIEVRHWGVLPLLHAALPYALARWIRWSLLPAGWAGRWLGRRARRYDGDGPEPGDLQGILATRTPFHEYRRDELKADLRAAGFRNPVVEFRPVLRGPAWLQRFRQEVNPWVARVEVRGG